MSATIIILSVLSIGLVALLISTALIARAQYIRAQKYETMILEIADDIEETYLEMKRLDDKQMFEKDDEVGVVFQDLADTITKLNERTQSKI